ncbi:MAG: M55 family metallopeptidase [Candidatus Poribacteria bacterium]|nr:M55 family metallopeptidase [Candidatus Poribacteria bacterium]
MKAYILTDLEGPAGVACWDQTRVDESPKKSVAMELLTEEINACVKGILDFDQKAEIVVLDGHGSGGVDVRLLHPKATLLFGKGFRPPTGIDESFDALFFVGQHAMAGTENGPLCHTYSSLNVEYYKLNGEYIGEFGCRTVLAGLYGVPTVFLAGDDKACDEATAFVPDIITVPTKQGMGVQLALHLSPKEARRRIRKGAQKASKRASKIEPRRIEPPYRLEVRLQEGKNVEGHVKRGARLIDDRTCVYETDDYLALPI